MADGDAVSDRATRGVSVCRDVCPIFTVIVWILSFITLTVRWMLHRARVVRRPLARLERRVLCTASRVRRGVVSLGTLFLLLSLAACTACMRTSRRPPTALLHQHSVDSAFAGKQITIQAGQSFIDRPGGVS